MSEIEERLRALGEKNAALEKRLAEVEAMERVRVVREESDAEIEDVLNDNTKSERDFDVARVKGVVRAMLAGSELSKSRAAYDAIAMIQDAPVHIAIEKSLETTVGADSIAMLRDVANVARKHGITFRELNLPLP